MLFQSACNYDSEEYLYPGSVCDTMETINYNEEVVFILSNKCYNCHSNSTAALSGNGVSFEGFANTNQYLNSSTYSFMAAIKHFPGYQPMPKNEPKLSPCEIRQLEIWITAGHLNN